MLATFILDTHTHLLATTSYDMLLRRASANLAALANEIPANRQLRGLCLAYRQGDRTLQELFKHRRREGIQQRALPDGSVKVKVGDQKPFFLFPGQQMVTKERIEVLALCYAGLPLRAGTLQETLSLILEKGAVPVIPWSLGKWWGKRRKILRDALVKSVGLPVYLGDISQRSLGGDVRGVLPADIAQDFQVLWGSDPLELPEEEKLIGTLGTTFRAEVDRAAPMEGLREALLGGVTTSPLGVKDSPLASFCRALKWRYASERSPT